MKAKTESLRRWTLGTRKLRGGVRAVAIWWNGSWDEIESDPATQYVLASDHEAALERCAKVVEAAKEVYDEFDETVLGSEYDGSHKKSIDALRTAIKEYEEGL